MTIEKFVTWVIFFVFFYILYKSLMFQNTCIFDKFNPAWTLLPSTWMTTCLSLRNVQVCEKAKSMTGLAWHELSMNDEAGHDASAAADELETLDPNPGPRCLITWTGLEIAVASLYSVVLLLLGMETSGQYNTDVRNSTNLKVCPILPYTEN